MCPRNVAAASCPSDLTTTRVSMRPMWPPIVKRGRAHNPSCGGNCIVITTTCSRLAPPSPKAHTMTTSWIPSANRTIAPS
eukprot:scaffold46211_cov90-Phaeocystis_antarctica.AAC.1